ncbi:MAG: hypothetical protein R3E08_10295 [Thiotrichaceae bacterium]
MNLFLIARELRPIFLCFVLLAAGCAMLNPRISHENYLKIANGMSEQEVSSILGEPTEVKSAGANVDLGSVMGISVGSLIGIDSLSGSYMKWQSSEATVHIVFVGGKVRLKNYNTN